jgi:hypothetical protein
MVSRLLVEVSRSFVRPGEDQDVVQIGETKVEFPQNVVHETLERLFGVAQAKGNSNRPNEVVIAVFCISSRCTEI